jgi:heme-degrading monooxygenase HmoA
MIRMFVRHEVADYDAWRTAYDEFDGTRSSMGVTDHAVYRSLEDPNDVTVWHDFDSEEAARAFADASELEAAMRSAGVTSTPVVWFTTPG